jgi:hypothetical protein
MRVIRAFFLALWLTLRGTPIQPKPVVSKYPSLEAWITVGLQRVVTVERIADKADIPQDKRKAVKLRLEGRDISMETILTAVHHNLTREYPLLLKTDIEHNLTTLYALNLNDQYRVAQLLNAPDIANTPIQNALYALSEHLKNIPPSNQP